ncbi:hypothetical protein FHX73_11933 [Kitasatospora viridis]|uniref:Methyltransferase family protein n=2 Tax=Kitasatospora viridis TaxID=281105 RepID=A0A561UCT4_9ACTN|nr:hypothetical protein FHX73_11933 [Kitasatospora viridis]
MHAAQVGVTARQEAPGSDDFYRDRGASAIMRAAHFPDELLAFLQLELLVARETVAGHGCDTLVELGCYDGRALEVARVAGVSYLGIDVNREGIEALKQRIFDEGLHGRADAVHGDALKSDEWQYRIAGVNPLHVVPFNLIGNFAEPAELLRELAKVGGIALVSVFNAEPWTTGVRRAYYSACGIAGLMEEPGRYGGVRFRGDDGFESESFGSEGFSELLAESGVKVLDESANRYGRCITIGLG